MAHLAAARHDAVPLAVLHGWFEMRCNAAYRKEAPKNPVKLHVL